MATIEISGVIDDATAARCRLMSIRNPGSELTVVVDSEGGGIEACMAAAAAIRTHAGWSIGYVGGQARADSGAALVFSACRARRAEISASFLLHEAGLHERDLVGQQHLTQFDFRAFADQLARLDDDMRGKMAAWTGCSASDLAALQRDGAVLSAQRALDFGLVTELVGFPALTAVARQRHGPGGASGAGVEMGRRRTAPTRDGRHGRPSDRCRAGRAAGDFVGAVTMTDPILARANEPDWSRGEPRSATLLAVESLELLTELAERARERISALEVRASALEAAVPKVGDATAVAALRGKVTALENRRQQIEARHLSAIFARLDHLESRRGSPGRGVTGARITGAGHLVLAFSDGSEQDVGIVRTDGGGK